MFLEEKVEVKCQLPGSQLTQTQCTGMGLGDIGAALGSTRAVQVVTVLVIGVLGGWVWSKRRKEIVLC